MIAFVFRPKRRVRGALVHSRFYSARVRLTADDRTQTIPLQVTDKRIAQEKLHEIVKERERELHGWSVPRLLREALQKPLAGHLDAFLQDLRAKGRSHSTAKHYRILISGLATTCQWTTLKDVTPESFTRWRAASALSPKTLNDRLGAVSTFLNWAERQRYIPANPLRHVGKVTSAQSGCYRRSLSLHEIERLLRCSHPSRAWIYLVIIYTGLRRHELNRLRWENFFLDGAFRVLPEMDARRLGSGDGPTPTLTGRGPSGVSRSASDAFVELPADITKNRKSARLPLRPEVVELLRQRHKMTRAFGPCDYVFRGKVPTVAKFRLDLAAASIPHVDDRGRVMDIHALRTTFGTMLSLSGVSPRVAMELMRHSDLKLTMKVYTDAAQLPLSEDIQRLPSYVLTPKSDTQISTQTGTQTPVLSGQTQSQAVGSGL